MSSPTSSSSSSAAEYTWKCGCGDIVVKFIGEPQHVVDCYCQSCIAAAKYCDARGGISPMSADGLFVKKCIFAHHQIQFLVDGAPEKMFYIKVKDDGKNYRSACKKCNTIFGTAGGCNFPPVQPVNREALKDAYGNSFKHDPEDVLRIMAIHSLTPEKIPEPKADDFHPSMLENFQRLTTIGSHGDFGDNEPAIKITDEMITVVLPKTWTDPV